MQSRGYSYGPVPGEPVDAVTVWNMVKPGVRVPTALIAGTGLKPRNIVDHTRTFLRGEVDYIRGFCRFGASSRAHRRTTTAVVGDTIAETPTLKKLMHGPPYGGGYLRLNTNLIDGTPRPDLYTT